MQESTIISISPTQTKDDRAHATVPLVAIDAVPRFVSNTPICVLHVGDKPPANMLVLDVFANHPRASAGRVAAPEPAEGLTLWLGLQQAALGWPVSSDVREGYYLFIDGQARAHHPGLLTDGDVLAFAFGGMFGLVGAAADDRQLSRFGSWISEYGVSIRVLRAFLDALPGDEAALFASLGTAGEPLDLARAFSRLDLSTDATRDEVERRHRELMDQHEAPRERADAPPVHRAFAEAVARVCAERRQQFDDALALIRARRHWN